MITLDEDNRSKPRILLEEAAAPAVIKVVGVGGGGCNALNRMIEAGVKGVEFIAVNTDGQALMACEAPIRVQLFTATTSSTDDAARSAKKALGAGCDPEVARKAALDRTDELIECLEGADMVFIAAGMGGGTGTGASPVIANLARDTGALTVAVVTTPFAFEGSRKAKIAAKGIEELRACVDTLITVPNERLLAMIPQTMPVTEAFLQADETLRNGVQGISDIINETGIINCDFADVEAVMRGGGMALMGIGLGSGEHRAREAAQQAFSSPLLDENALDAAQRVLVNFCGGEDTTLAEVCDAADFLKQRCAEDCLFIFGYGQRPELTGKVQVTVVATGFGASGQSQPAARPLERPAQREEPAVQTAAAKSPFLAGDLPPDYGINVGNFSEFDIPTYLRRQMD